MFRVAFGKAAGEVRFSADGHRLRPHQYGWRKVHDLCDADNVPRVYPHRLHATLAVEEGASGEAVARALGHPRFDIPRAHYATPASVANARLENVGQFLAPSASRSKVPTDASRSAFRCGDSRAPCSPQKGARHARRSALTARDR